MSGNDLHKSVASNPPAQSLLRIRLDQLQPDLVQQISHDLASLELRKTTACRLISILVRLDRSELARDVFLKARREVMLKRVRAIKAEGDISIYISELAIVCFTVIRHTSDWYMTAFKENRMASGELRLLERRFELTSRFRDVGKRAGRDICGYVPTSGVPSDYPSWSCGRVCQSRCFSQSKGEQKSAAWADCLSYSETSD